ncbi:MAG: ribonuclease R [Bacteroidales bacterium]|nr:ribonuclease R [Bacteroidales bacterium]
MSKKKKQPNSFADNLLSVFGKDPLRPLNHKQVAAGMGVKDKASHAMVQQVIHQLITTHVLEEVKRGKYRLAADQVEKYTTKQKYITGRLDMKTTGKAYLIREEGEDVFIAAGNTGTALDGDTVKIMIFPRRSQRKLEGKVVEVVERSKKQYAGIVDKIKNFAYVVVDGNKTPVDIFIPSENLNGATNGDKVVVEIVAWNSQSRNPLGNIVRVLGQPGNNNVEMQSILLEFNLPIDFSEEVEREADKISNIIPDSEIAKRRDFRDIWTITIDPADAKDFDDALSLRKLDNGNWEVGVHIADVTHYIQPNTILEKEAATRATSVYLVDRVVPMLPEKLSNELCSLRPDEDKLTFAAVFEMNEQARIVSEWIGKTVIRSNRRYAYEEVQKMIDGAEGDYKAEVTTLYRLSALLREERARNGAINFESREVKFKLDDNGVPISVAIKEDKEANWLIEEFMLLANRKVAERIGKTSSSNRHPKTFVYRIHDMPNPDKLTAFASLVSRLGYKINIQSRKHLTDSFNKLFTQVEGKGEQNMIETVALRTMAKAVYTSHNIGHYGLAFDYYTHFTSPIRRYPDMMVHRLLDRYLSGGSSVAEAPLESQCEHASNMERRAQEAERASIKYKQAEFLENKVGQTFDGKVSGISKWGVFVEINDNYCEGMMRINDMVDDYYYIDEENYRIIGYHSQKIIRIGDPIKIKIKRVDLRKREIDFVMA